MNVFAGFLAAVLTLYILGFTWLRSRYTGVNAFTIFVFCFFVFYIAIPALQLFAPEDRNTLTAYGIILNATPPGKVMDTLVSCCLLLAVFVVVYLLWPGRRFELKPSAVRPPHRHAQQVLERWGDRLLLVGGLSVLAVAVGSGGLSQYLALGTQTRGLDTASSQALPGFLLPALTTSQLILIPPYLYACVRLMDQAGSRPTRKLILSGALALVYLVGNQGRAPLILFLLPFILYWGPIRRRAVVALTLLGVVSLFILNPLNRLFAELSNETVQADTSRGAISTLLLEFSYPFTNFSNRNLLAVHAGNRNFEDYLTWPMSLVPETLLSLVGLSKAEMYSSNQANTAAYSSLTGAPPSGGIPVDVLTFQYFEGGMIAVLIAVVLIGVLLKWFDQHLAIVSGQAAIAILGLHAILTIVAVVPNADPSVIARTRIDGIITAMFVIYLCRSAARPVTHATIYNREGKGEVRP